MSYAAKRVPQNMQGPLVIIGGAEERDGECEILNQFVQLAGGSRARIVVIAVASSSPEETGKLYVEIFKRLGDESHRR